MPPTPQTDRSAPSAPAGAAATTDAVSPAGDGVAGTTLPVDDSDAASGATRPGASAPADPTGHYGPGYGDPETPNAPPAADDPTGR